MEGLRRSQSCLMAAIPMCFLFLLNSSFCWSLDDEGVALLKFKERVASDPYEKGVETPCSRVGVRCSKGHVLLLNSKKMEKMKWRKLLQESPKRRLAWFFPFPVPPPPPPEFVIISAPPPPVFSLSPPSPVPALNPVSPPSSLPPHGRHVPPAPSVDAPAGRPSAPNRTSSKYRHQLIVTSAIGGFLLLVIFITGILFCYFGKMTPVKPWATGISGQLQRAFVTGVPKLKRSELEAACEDFSNVIGSSSACTLYKGTLSSGVEIAVASIAVSSAKEWTSSQESQFRKKIDTLSKVNHKNFVNLLGYCMEDEPFTRMLVFEYAPNGTLFEHLHIKEAEHLDWAMRLRIAMGVAYCLEHMHQLTPALVHRNLTSSTVYLAEDYAAKLSDLIYQDEGSAVDIEPTRQNNVYSFGILLFEIITGRLPHSVGGDSLQNWTTDSLRVQNIREIVDPTLRTYDEEQLQQIGDVIRSCTNPDPRGRPNMKEVCATLRVVTTVGPDGAVPKLSPLWWAELEILSAEAD